jgi:arabinofuranosyltransferase
MISRDKKKLALSLLAILPAIGIFVYLAVHLNFTQDDAYISYRYVANYLHGHGLVYNVGERVEGFTNFGWVVYLLLWGSWGLNFLLVSKLTGYVLGGALVVISYLIAKEVLGEKGGWYAVLVGYLVGINQSVAYWSPAGLETAAFSVAVGLSMYWWVRRSWLLIAGMVLSVWFRPEGAVVCGVLLIAEGIVEKRIPKFTLYSLMAAFVLSLPMLGFKLGYYGGILPNPFYAKTSFHLDQVVNGWEYTWQFLQHYGFYGLGLIVPLAFYGKLTASQQKVWWLVLGYMAYITLIGGDVLKVHRFYIPVVGASALLAVLSVWVLVEKQKVKTQHMALFLVTLAMIPMTWMLPRETVKTYNVNEKRFVFKMEYTAREMKRTDLTSFSVATPTIGVFGYELLDHPIVDMLGLTDSTIARSSEPPIPGMMTTWKEQKHNSKYLLGRAPDYIVFSTGAKPSAPAERALLLIPAFMNCYRAIGWYFPTPEQPGSGGLITPAFKRMSPMTGDLTPTYPVKYVQYYKTGLDYYTQGRYAKAVANFDSAAAASPKPVYIYVSYYKAFCLFLMQKHELAEPLLNSIVAVDSTLYEPHKELYLYARLEGDVRKAEIHKRWLLKLVPWFFPKVQALADQQVAEQRRTSPGGN